MVHYTPPASRQKQFVKSWVKTEGHPGVTESRRLLGSDPVPQKQSITYVGDLP